MVNYHHKTDGHNMNGNNVSNEGDGADDQVMINDVDDRKESAEQGYWQY